MDLLELLSSFMCLLLALDVRSGLDKLENMFMEGD